MEAENQSKIMVLWIGMIPDQLQVVQPLANIPGVSLNNRRHLNRNWVSSCVSNNTPLSAYRKTSNIRRTLVGNKTVDHSDVVRASPVGAAPTTSSFST